jgi:hypothetical protein
MLFRGDAGCFFLESWGMKKDRFIQPRADGAVFVFDASFLNYHLLTFSAKYVALKFVLR